MKVLAIESSCDDTSVAVVNDNKYIFSNIVISQVHEHASYGGVVPEIAARSHFINLRYTITKALEQSSFTLQDVDVIAATAGPGLIGGVIVGVAFASTLAFLLKKRFLAINHLEGHLLAVRLVHHIAFPYLTLLVSGGHCQFVAVLGVGNYKILGQTLDDAAGEAFDKVAKLLGLGYPGGPIIEQLAKKGNPNKYLLPLAMVSREGCDLSFSGLKTAVKLLVSKVLPLNDQKIYDICASFQYTVAKILQKRSQNAIMMFEQYLRFTHHTTSNISSFVISGGVAANQYIKLQIAEAIKYYNYQLFSPPIDLCTDNAAMISWAGIERIKANKVDTIVESPRARWSLEEL